MTRERAKELLPVIAAYAEGKTVQYKPNLTPQSEWRDVSIIVGDCLDGDSFYRIKPEPRVWYACLYHDQDSHRGCLWEKHKDAMNQAQACSVGGDVIKVQEVI